MTQRQFIDQLAEDIGADGVRAVVGIFAQDLDRLLSRLREAVASSDALAFHRAAHGLAGAAGAVGAAELERACRAAMAQRDAGPAGLPTLLGEIEAKAGPARSALDELVATLLSAG